MMGLLFSYFLSECDDYRLCKLEKGVLSKSDPHHWHLMHSGTGGDWTYRTQDEALDKLVSLVKINYAKFYQAQDQRLESLP